MSRINNHPQPRFAGYTLDRKKGEAKLWLPGHSNLNPDNLFAAVIKPGESTPKTIKMARSEEGDYWVPSKDEPQTVPLGSDYRFYVEDRFHTGSEKPSITGYPMEVDGNNPGASQANLESKGNGVWEFDNPLPTAKKGKQTLELTIPDNGKPEQLDVSRRWRLERLDKGQDPVALSLSVKKYIDANNKVGTKLVFTDLDGAATSRYRLSPNLDLGEVVQRGDLGSFTHISSLDATAPQKSPNIADVLQDCALTDEKFVQAQKDERERLKLGKEIPAYPHLPRQEMRSPFNRFALKDEQGLKEASLKSLIGRLHNQGFRALLMKPAVGGDKQSSHGYWTEDTYVLNHSFSSKDAFRDFAGALTSLDMKPIADGAFVNMGLTSVHQSANRTYGLSSPYWRWFKHGDEAVNAAPTIYPQQAREKAVYGILPTTQDENGLAKMDLSNLAVRVINDPEDTTKTYDPKKPTFIQPYDTRLEDADGKPRLDTHPKILKSTDSVQPYKFAVDPQELKAKQDRNLKSMLEWNKFRLDIPSKDNSGAKWDGQIDTALLNTRNPEVVNYLKGAVTYWTRFVMNTNVRNVTHAMMDAQANHKAALPYSELVSKITQSQGELDTYKDENGQPIKDEKHPDKLLANAGFQKFLKEKPLPPVVNPDIDEMDPAELKKIADSVAPDHAENQNGKAFAKRLLKEVPMDVLPLPTLFKANLSYPGLEQALSTANRGKFARFMSDSVLGNLARIPLLGRIFQSIRNYFYPRPFQKELAHKMQDIFKQLSPDVQNRLRYGNVQSLLADQVGEVLYLSLFTGKQPDDIKAMMSDPNASRLLEEAFYKGMPAHILHADPVTASKFIPELLSKRLKDLSPKQMGNLVEAEVQHLDPQMAAVAQAVLNQRELGLNWRIDAAKDVGDMNRIKEAPNHERAKIFKQEFDYVMDFWGKVSKPIREIFPKTLIEPEVTDLELLSGANLKDQPGIDGKAALKEVKKNLFKDGVFNGMPNMRYGFSAIKQLVHMDGEPYKFGQSQSTLGQFLDTQREYAESLPRPVIRNSQNMTSSHDFMTDSHNLLTNSQPFHMDKEKNRGLKEDLVVAIDELQHKVCFENERRGLDLTDTQNLGKILDALRTKLFETGFKEKFNDRELKGFFDKTTKGKNATTETATPPQLKPRFVDELFNNSKILKPEDLGVDQKQMALLRDALKARISEPSEAKAMRAAIVNATEDYLKSRTADTATDKLTPESANAIRNAIWPALNQVTLPVNEGGYGSHFGYQPLDYALHHVFDNIKPTALLQGEELEKVKLGIYDTATRPVMDKLQREYALQVAVPGMPSIYLHDLLAQYGGESKNNTHLQNRNILRTDKLNEDAAHKDPQFLEYFDNVGKLLNARSNKALQALNDGELLPVTPDEKSGIIPIVRDNGKQQVITLVNVGAMPTDQTKVENKKIKEENKAQPESDKKPLLHEPLDWLHKAGTGKTYEMPQRNRSHFPKKQDEPNNEIDFAEAPYQLDLSELGMNHEKIAYRDVHTGELFKLNEKGLLHPADKPTEGILVDNWRMLERVNQPVN